MSENLEKQGSSYAEKGSRLINQDASHTLATLQAELEQARQREAHARGELQQATRQIRRLSTDLFLTEQRVRQKVAQLLHDELQQQLFATQVHIQFLSQALQFSGQKTLLADAQEVKAMLDEALQMTRRLTLDLAPSLPPEQNLAGIISGVAEHMQELHNLVVKVELEPYEEPLGHDLSQIIFQIVRELLFNVVKHAGVHRALVQGHQEADQLVIQVIDNGDGFEVAPDWQLVEPENSFGLHHIARHLHLLGGKLELVSQPGQGTTITITIPAWNPDPVPPETTGRTLSD